MGYNRLVNARDRSGVERRTVLLLAGAVCGAMAWILLTRWGVVIHGHPAYAVLIGLTVVGTLAGVWRWNRRMPSPTTTSRGRQVLRTLGVLLALAWIAGLAWLRPFPAGATAMAAMTSDAKVSVAETATQITLTPETSRSTVGVFFQPGARVDARAYAAHLRPLAEAGHLVVIAKQPLGIAFLATGAFESAMESRGEIQRWVIAGHSLGGTVAAMEAADLHASQPGELGGLVLWGSYPASPIDDLTPGAALSISGSQDGLSTPADIDASRADLPADTAFEVIEGGSHAQFGDYGAQPGDGTPTISADQARAEISAATLAFVERLTSP